jgi:serine/threonine protein kinase
MIPPRWLAMNESEYPWEREALGYLCEHLPNYDPWHAWANFEFIDDVGKVNEVDVLVLSPRGLFLIEIKSRPGNITGDAGTWTWNTEGRLYSRDNPIILANRKAKRIKGLLQRQSSIVKSKLRLPYVQELIFLSAQHVRCDKLPEVLRQNVYRRGRPGDVKDDGIIAALLGNEDAARPAVTRELGRAIGRAMGEAGIRPSQRHKKVGDYELGKMLAEGDTWQDFDGKHVSAKVHRRIRIYPYAKTTSEAARSALIGLASREFRLLQDIDHPDIVRVLELKESERGPALFFEHDPNATRLDFVLREHGKKLSVETRLHILRRLAETLKYTHEKRLFHRSLSPQSVLVRDLGNPRPRLQIMNWHTASREGSSAGSGVATSGTLHPDDYIEDPAKVYMAPETLLGAETAGAHHDVFSLGAIAYHVFTGTPPATSPLELGEKLRARGGLQLSDVIDGANAELQELIRLATHPDVSLRIVSMDEFLARLTDVERELRLPPAEKTVDPADAKADDRLEGGFAVVRRLGRGASADAVLIIREGSDEPFVLKVAIDPQHNDRLKAEGDVLAKIRHPNIVRWCETLTVAGRAALLMERAGDKTLAQRLREGRLSLDLARRFGEDLLTAVDYLEQEGIAHRDIKPDNIGIAQAGGTGQLRLVLFDFSLSRMSADNIRAGTPPYVDPFLTLRKPPRWDLASERFAAAVTLYEMLTGMIPVWGDGKSDPALLDCEATLHAELFDPHLRDGLTAFFAKTFRRDPKARFDNVEEMLRAWRHVFESARPVPVEADGFASVARQANAATPVADLGYGIEALDVLGRMGIQTVRQLLAVDRIKFRYLANVGDRIRKEIRLKAKELARLRPDLVPGQPSVLGSEGEDAACPSIDRLTEQLLPRRPAGEDMPEDRALADYLGLEGNGATLWATIGDAAGRCGMSRDAVTAAILKGRERWGKFPSITRMRDDIDALLSAQGGVMTATEAAAQVLAARGSYRDDHQERLRLASAIVRAASEVEGALVEPRFQGFAEAVPLIAKSEEAALCALELGEAADRLADADPLPSPQRVVETLQAIVPTTSVTPLAPQRLPKLATAVAERARLSSRGEIYPKGLAAARALRLAVGALVGPATLTVAEIRSRVEGRFPEAEPLPDRPELDALLADAGAELKWDEAVNAYRRLTMGGTSTDISGPKIRHQTEGLAVELTPEVLNARAFEDKLAYTLKTGGFIALTCEPRHARTAEAELMRRFPRLARLSFDALLLDAMTAEAEAKTVDWTVVLKADAAGRGSRDWSNLLRLVTMAAPAVEARLSTATEPVLLVHPGLIARYDLMPMLTRLAGDAGNPGCLPALVVLVPMPLSGPPSIDGHTVPVIGAAQWAAIPEAWIANAHRAGTRAA